MRAPSFLTEAGLLELPEAVGQLATLRKLFLTHNALRMLPGSLAGLTQLQALLANDNVFKVSAACVKQNVVYYDCPQQRCRRFPADSPLTRSSAPHPVGHRRSPVSSVRFPPWSSCGST